MEFYHSCSVSCLKYRRSTLFLLLFSVSFEHINNFKNLFPGKVLYKDYKIEESKDFQSSENMDLSGIFAANRNILKSVCRLLKKSKRTLFQKKTQNKYLKPPHGGDQNKTETQESTPVEVSNLDKDSKDTTSLQNEWLIHLVLGNLPRDGGFHLIETDTPNITESDHGTVSIPKQGIKRNCSQS